MLDLVALGEPLVQFNAVTEGPLRYVAYFEKHSAGSEANVCVAASKLGLRSGLITRLGNDEFGLFIYEWLRGQGVDVSRIKFDPERPTGIYFVQRSYPVPGVSTVLYYRRGSAASALSPSDLDEEYIADSRIFHTTSITMAISDSAREAAFRGVEIARRRNVMVSFDVNIRRLLWPSIEDAVKAVEVVLRNVNVLFLDENEAELLFGTKDPQGVFREAEARFGISRVILKMGLKGSVARWDGETVSSKAFQVPVKDPIGAGDAYAGVFLASVLKGLPPSRAIVRASAAAAMVVMVRGDEENLPREQDLETFLRNYGLSDVELR
ncbi:bifunctional 2-dehydro-3-deoxygluconokinase/2-dehydro-3-deoxygalactonokinase [Caldivirga sp. UBA161]|uniref:bifunctional 2-dehydro-3-deoxygluconokinase/2-dehydro-3- deoxygalactonokinase n=1 Tax=Caldivirga sp. UBA161 TaxID=1915569 RepID=UPI0025BFBE64|nr:bifunctional 2-dehydro-3-deoxygluconokinase/2-dehydro-3-deoxygalactonokinase [Caldivirga sp. UBA161]